MIDSEIYTAAVGHLNEACALGTGLVEVVHIAVRRIGSGVEVEIVQKLLSLPSLNQGVACGSYRGRQ
jgi:hypothetical protein